MNTGSVEDDFQTVVLKIWELLSLYRGNRSQTYDYICRHLSAFVSSCDSSDDCHINVHAPRMVQKKLTPPPVEAIIDLWYMRPWDLYLLWQHNIEGHSVREIENLTSISKTLIAEDIRNITNGYH